MHYRREDFEKHRIKWFMTKLFRNFCNMLLFICNPKLQSFYIYITIDHIYSHKKKIYISKIWFLALDLGQIETIYVAEI